MLAGHLRGDYAADLCLVCGDSVTSTWTILVIRARLYSKSRRPMQREFELCAETLQACEAAELGGADRIANAKTGHRVKLCE